MTIWIDADGLPVRIRSIVERAARRTATPAVFVSDRPLPLEAAEPVSLVLVEEGADSADLYIEEHGAAGDMAVTRDVLLSSRLVEGGLSVLDDRGSLYTEENIRERVSMRERMRELRELGVETDGRRKGLSERDIRSFAETLDRELSRRLREERSRPQENA